MIERDVAIGRRHSPFDVEYPILNENETSLVHFGHGVAINGLLIGLLR